MNSGLPNNLFFNLENTIFRYTGNSVSQVVTVSPSLGMGGVRSDKSGRLFYVEADDENRLIRWDDGNKTVLDSSPFFYLCDVTSDGSTVVYTCEVGGEAVMACWSNGDVRIVSEQPGLAMFSADDDLLARSTDVPQASTSSEVVIETVDGDTKQVLGEGDEDVWLVKDWHPSAREVLVERHAEGVRPGVYDVDRDDMEWFASRLDVEVYSFNADGDAFAVFDNDVMRQGGVVQPQVVEIETGGVVDVPVPEGVEVRQVVNRCAPVRFDSGGFVARGLRSGGREDIVGFDLDGVEVLVAGERDTEDVGDPEWVVFESFDGVDVEAWLWRASDEAGPTIVYLHGGGPHGRVTKYDDQTIIYRLVKAGFHVFAVNYRGATGRDKSFHDAVKDDLGGIELRDTVQGVEWLRDSGVVQGGVGVFGHSFGGYEVLIHLVKHSDVWDAGVASAAHPSFDNATHVEDWFPERADDEAFIRSRSPLYRAGEIDTPLLALHGEEDLACPVEDMREFDKAVQEKASLSGEEYRFEVFEGVGHVLQGSEAEEKRDELVVEFFSEHLD